MNGQRVAIVGASTDRRKYGNKSVRAHAAEGWAVFPVHPSAAEIEGHRAFSSLRDVPRPIDRVSLYLPPERGLDVLADVAAVAPAEFYVNPGAESDELIAAARALGLDPIQACSIVDVGRSPREYPDA